MLSAALLIAYDPIIWCAFTYMPATLPMLPAVLDTCRIFFVGAFSSKGSSTCESSAGPAAFVRTTFRNASGSSVNAESTIACRARSVADYAEQGREREKRTMPALLMR